MKKILFVCLSMLLIITGCQKTDPDEEEIQPYQYDLSNPDEKAFAEFVEDEEGKNLDGHADVAAEHVKVRARSEKEYSLFKLVGRSHEEDRGKKSSTSFLPYSIGAHDKPYNITVTFVYGDKRIAENAFVLPPSEEEQTLYYCLDLYDFRLAFIEEEKISALYEFDMNEFVGFKIYCDRCERKALASHYQRKVDDKAIIDKFLYYLRTEDEEKTEDSRTDKKLFVTIEAEAVQ